MWFSLPVGLVPPATPPEPASDATSPAVHGVVRNRLFHRWAHNTAFRAKARNALFRIVGIATRRAFFAWRRHVKVLKETEMEATREEATTRGATLSEELEITSGMLVEAQVREAARCFHVCVQHAKWRADAVRLRAG